MALKPLFSLLLQSLVQQHAFLGIFFFDFFSFKFPWLSPWLSIESQEGQRVRLNASVIVVGFEYIGGINCRVGGLLACNSVFWSRKAGWEEGNEGWLSPGVVSQCLQQRSPAWVELRQNSLWKWRALATLGSLSPGVRTLSFAVPGRFELFRRIWFCSEYGIVRIPFEHPKLSQTLSLTSDLLFKI